MNGDGHKLSSNTEASGRFHTDWLNMMYPRLKLARNLLTAEGAIFVSISDHEVAGLRFLLADIFGEENFSAQLVWKSRKYPDSRAKTGVSTDHEYIMVFARSEAAALRGVERDETKFANPDNDARGPWMSRSLLGLASKSQRPNLHYPIAEPQNGQVFNPPEDTGWRYSPERMNKLIMDGCVLFPAKGNGRPREKKFRADIQSEFVAFPSIIDDIFTSDGTAEIREIFGEEVFDFTKPTKLLAQIINQAAGADGIVLDFFAGSGTTGQAVMASNANDGGSRRFILVQLPEPLNPKDINQRSAAEFCSTIGKPRTIAELTKERLRRGAKKINRQNSMFSGDRGFRVFKLDTSNIRTWEPDRENLEQTLLDNIEHIKPGRSEQDVLYELLLKLGLDLCVLIETRIIAGKVVHAIGAGTLLVCLDEVIAREHIESLAIGMAAWHQELAPASDSTVVFRDSAFADDVAKTNLVAILVQHGFSEKLVQSL